MKLSHRSGDSIQMLLSAKGLTPFTESVPNRRPSCVEKINLFPFFVIRLSGEGNDAKLGAQAINCGSERNDPSNGPDVLEAERESPLTLSLTLKSTVIGK